MIQAGQELGLGACGGLRSTGEEGAIPGLGGWSVGIGCQEWFGKLLGGGCGSERKVTGFSFFFEGGLHGDEDRVLEQESIGFGGNQKGG